MDSGASQNDVDGRERRDSDATIVPIEHPGSHTWADTVLFNPIRPAFDTTRRISYGITGGLNEFLNIENNPIRPAFDTTRKLSYGITGGINEFLNLENKLAECDMAKNVEGKRSSDLTAAPLTDCS